MAFNKRFYEKEFRKLLRDKTKGKFFIKDSQAFFKIKKFINKSTQSFELAKYLKESEQDAKDYWTIIICYYSMLYLAKALILTRGYETDDHYSTQIALGCLFVPDKLEKKDLDLLDEAFDIFEEEYIDYFEDARKESSVSRYSATKVYTQRRVEEIFENARKFISKLLVLLEEWM